MSDIAGAFDDYREHIRALVVARNLAAYGRSGVTSPRLCMRPWPPSLADAAPAPCQLVQGHHSRHYHRPRGGTASVEWT